jgi:hypothetical protein
VSNPAEVAAVAACKQEVQTQPTTSAIAKIHLERVCEKAAGAPSGDTAAAGDVLEELQAALSH